MRHLTVEEVYETEFQSIRKRQAKLLVEEELASLNSDLKSLEALKAKYALKRRASMYETAMQANEQQRLVLPESHAANSISLKHWIVLTNHEIRDSEQRDLKNSQAPSSPAKLSSKFKTRDSSSRAPKLRRVPDVIKTPTPKEEKKNEHGISEARSAINKATFFPNVIVERLLNRFLNLIVQELAFAENNAVLCIKLQVILFISIFCVYLET
jgi:hypothetical protein